MSGRCRPVRRSQQTGEGLVGREVILRVERRLWHAKGAPPLPDEIRMDALGWVLKDGKRYPIESPDAPRVAPGERYLAPLALVEFDEGPEWWPLTPSAQLPVKGDVVTPAAGNRDTAPALSGLSLDEAANVIHAAEPDPVAAELIGLRPQERVQAVADRRGPQPAP